MPATITDPRAWSADTVDAPERWYYPLSDRAASALATAIRENASRPVTEVRATDALRAVCADDIAPILDALEKGRGFAVVTPGKPGVFAADDLPALYWLVGELLGKPFAQNVQGTLLYDVRDTGQDVR